MGECGLPTIKIVISGGTSQVGRILCRALASAGDEVVVVSRTTIPGDPRGGCKNCNGIFLPPKPRVLITDTRAATGLVAHRNHCVRISAVWSNVVALGCAVAGATRS